MTLIKFGTDGWRAVIGEEFTFTNVRRVAQAIVNYLKEAGSADRGLVVGYDNRFMSENFALEAARVAAANGIKAYLSSSAAPTPAVSFAVKEKKAAGGIMITASHNPPKWNGLKFKGEYAGSAFPEITREIERHVQRLAETDQFTRPATPLPSFLTEFDPKKNYLKQVAGLVDLDLISRANLKVVVDPMFGSGIGYLAEILSPRGVDIGEINNHRDPLFGGINPEPILPNLKKTVDYIQKLKSDKLLVGVVLDGDADRVAAIDPSGKFINSHYVFTLLLHHLVEYRAWSGAVVKTYNMTEMIDRLCEKYERKLFETPIGFKFVADLMLKEDILMGGEESGGYGIKNHIPERDGVLVGLLLCEMMAARKKTLWAILEDIMGEIGYHFYDRVDLRIEDEARKKQIFNALEEKPPSSLAGKKVVKVGTLDGVKLFLEDGSWVLFRASGTEPLLRIYAESRSEEEVRKLLTECTKEPRAAAP